MKPPDISGYEVAARLRHRALQAGIDHHLGKPVKPDELDRLLMGL